MLARGAGELAGVMGGFIVVIRHHQAATGVSLVKPLTRHQRAGARAIDNALRECAQASMPLYRAACIADAAARAIGRQRDLYPSLYYYERLLPRDAGTAWVGEASGEAVLSVINPYYRGQSPVHACVPIPGPFDIATDAYLQPRLVTGG